MSIGYSTAAVVLCGAHASNLLGSASGRPESPSEKAFGVFNALGSMAFAFSFSSVLMEVQSTLHEPPKVLPAMKRAIHGGLSVSLTFYAAVSTFGYLSLGDATPGDILTGFNSPAWLVTVANAMVLVHMVSAYQVFSQPVFQLMEEGLRRRCRCADALPPWQLRLGPRCCYVLVSTTVAASVPYFAAFIGLAGALVFWPAAVLFPTIMWAVVHRPGRYVRALLVTVNTVAALVSLLAVVGAVHEIRAHMASMHGEGER